MGVPNPCNSQFPGTLMSGQRLAVHTVHHEVRGAVGEGFHIMEFPFPVKGQAEGSVLAVIDDGIGSVT